MTPDPVSLNLAAQWVRRAKHVVVFSGAGASAESGIPTFRDAGGFWQEFPPERFATWSGLVEAALREPRQVLRFVLALIEPIAQARPNAGHVAAAELEKYTNVTVVTQNIDGLHQEAGSTTVYEVHGSLFEIVTTQGRFVRLVSRRQVSAIAEKLRAALHQHWPMTRLLLAIRPILGLGPTRIHQPNLVLFGEAMAEPAWTKACEAARACDCFISVGTSGAVYPAAALPGDARRAGAKIIVVDPREGGGDVWLRGTASEVLPKLVAIAFGLAAPET